jgi:prepilin-type processing-associated H-X9-DG protein
MILKGRYSMNKFLHAFAAFLAMCLALAAPGGVQAAPVAWNAPVPSLLAAPAVHQVSSAHVRADGSFQLAFARGRHMKGGAVVGNGWNGTTIDCNGVPYLPGVIAAGDQAAWDTVCDAGPRVTSWNAAPSTGGNFLNGGLDIEVNGGTNTLAAPDLSGYRLWVFGGADLTLNDPKFNCVSGAACNFGRMASLGYDSGQTPRTPATLRINYGDLNSIGRTETVQQEVLVIQGSTLRTSHTRFQHGAMDFIQTGDIDSVYHDHDFVAAFCEAGLPESFPGAGDQDHCEADHPYGTVWEAHYSRFDPNIGGPITGGFSAILFLDGHVASGVQTNVCDHSVVSMVPGFGNWTIYLAGNGTMTLYIGGCAIRKGTSGYLAANGHTVVETAPNYDLDTGARLICGVTAGYPASCFLVLFVFYRRRPANDNGAATAARKRAA